MAAAVMRFMRMTVSNIGSLSFFPADIEVERPRFNYPTTEEAWRRDWENIGGDFRRAFSRLEGEIGAQR